MADKVAQIAAKLTEAQRKAIVELAHERESSFLGHVSRSIVARHLATKRGGARNRPLFTLTPLGEAVRAHLEQVQ